eukprot:jgi/Ulvmu1/189/UM001_0193.1
MPVIIHVDIDAFFVQVEQMRHPELRGLPIALQQHGDIFAANAPAKAAGVTKHIQPDEARKLLRAVHGKVVHVHLEDGYRISYRPYREMSDRFFKLLRQLEEVEVIERASIDEAFILCRVGAAALAGDSPLEVGAALGAQVRELAAQQLQLAVSVGVASNRLLAKLASARAKPDGLSTLQPSAVPELLASTPITRLPGFGGRVAQQLAQHGIRTATDLQAVTPGALRALCPSLSEASAATLLQYAHGVDPVPPRVRPPPKTLSLQMTLTPVPLPMHPSAAGPAAAAAPAAAGRDDDRMLMPLQLLADDAGARMQSLLSVMLRDLLGRVWLDSEMLGRWPTSLTLRVRTNGPTGAVLSRAKRFPPFADISSYVPAEVLPQPRAGGDTAHVAPAAPRATGDAQEPAQRNTHAVVVDMAMSMFQDMQRSSRESLPVVQVHVGAAKLEPLGSSKMKPLAAYFGGRADGAAAAAPAPRTAAVPPAQHGVAHAVPGAEGASSGDTRGEREARAARDNESDGGVYRVDGGAARVGEDEAAQKVTAPMAFDVEFRGGSHAARAVCSGAPAASAAVCEEPQSFGCGASGGMDRPLPLPLLPPAACCAGGGNGSAGEDEAARSSAAAAAVGSREGGAGVGKTRVDDEGIGVGIGVDCGHAGWDAAAAAHVDDSRKRQRQPEGVSTGGVVTGHVGDVFTAGVGADGAGQGGGQPGGLGEGVAGGEAAHNSRVDFERVLDWWECGALDAAGATSICRAVMQSLARQRT